MFLLDTNVISELRKGKNTNPLVLKWSQSVSIDSLYISCISLMELEMGMLSVSRKDSLFGQKLHEWIHHQIIPTFSKRTLPIDARVALCCAKLHIPDRRSERDALIAATAIVHDLTVITRNTADFEATGVKFLNPWEDD